ncbi:MAG: tetratricopeptide repeat protein [Arenicellales bacterium]|nr:tetratricopeptide repeat protein [Arenicellales bacterium]
MTGYSTNEVADLLGLRPEQVRAFVKTGLLNAAIGHVKYHRYRYSFQDIVLLRMAKQLREANAGTHAIARTLRTLKARLPAGKSLSSVRVVVVGHDVLVREQDSLWDPESGQIQIDFPMSSLTREVAPMVKAAARDAHLQINTSADDWYDLGIDLEMIGDYKEAKTVYRKAIEQDPAHTDACVNLGRLLHISGETEEALSLFNKALEINPQHATAWFNLGVVQEGRDATDQAITAYERVLSLDDSFPDAHYNLARLYEQTGDKQGAVRHLNAYKRLHT